MCYGATSLRVLDWLAEPTLEAEFNESEGWGE